MGLHVYPPLRCFQTLPDIFGSIFESGKEFDKLLKRRVGNKGILYTYRARTGLFHLLKFLKKEHNIKRIFVPSYTCKEVVHPIKKSGLHIEFVDNNLETLGIEDSNVKMGKTDAILIVNYFGIESKPSKRTLSSGAVIIEDNASFFKKPSKYADFTLYSFGKGKEFSSSEGGVVTVNNKIYKNFLNFTILDKPDIIKETIRFIDYLIWRLGTLRLFYRFSKGIKSAISSGKENFEFGNIENVNLTICEISKKLGYRQLMKFNELQRKSKNLWELFLNKINDIADITIIDTIENDSNFFSVNMLVESRDGLKKFLEKKGVFTSIPWNYNIGEKLSGKHFQNANKIHTNLLQLKIDPTYMKNNDIEYIAECFREFYES